MAGVRMTERSATGFRFAVPTYMERLIITNIRDEAPHQLMLEAFFSPVNARVPHIMPPPAALALMRPGFMEHVISVVRSTLPPGFLLGLTGTHSVRPGSGMGLASLVPVKATRCVDTEDEPPARAEDIDSVMEAVVAQMKERELKEQGLTLFVPGKATVPEAGIPEAAIPKGDERSESLPEGDKQSESLPEAGIHEATVPEGKKPDVELFDP